MADEFNLDVADSYKAHREHGTYTEGCSTCWSENLRLQRDKEEVKEHNDRTLRGGLFGNSSPWDKNPLD